MEPIIKWAGGKRKFVDQIISITGNKCNRYFEPFLGGGALLLNIKAKSYFCSDINGELINFHNVVKNNVNGLINELKKNFIPNHSKKFYIQVRNIDRDLEKFNNLTDVERAARFYYLNKACFNGIWRVNSKGQHNVPFGKSEKPPVINSKLFKELSNFYLKNKISFRNVSYKECVKTAKLGDFVYFDPPYDVEKGQSSFVSYTKSGFNRKNQKELKLLCDRLIKKGVKVAISNSDTKFIRELYSDSDYATYEIHDKIVSNRTIAASKNARKPVVELLIIGRMK